MLYKKHVIVGLLLIFFSLVLSAQERYEYVMVKYITNLTASSNGIWISKAGKDWERAVELDKKEIASVVPYLISYGPMLAYIEKMTNDGWEIVSTSDGFGNYLMRRKKG